MSFCQVDSCQAELAAARTYHRRHRVCELHSKSSTVLVAGFLQRFCQQCSRFHKLSEFIEAKRSCQRSLAAHNVRRRKVASGSQDNGSPSGSMPPSSPSH